MSWLSKAFSSASHAVSHIVQQVPIIGKPAVSLVDKTWHQPVVRGLAVGAGVLATGGAGLLGATVAEGATTYGVAGAAAGAAYESAAGGNIAKGALLGGGLGYGVASYAAGSLAAGTAAKYAAGGAVLTGAVNPSVAAAATGALPGDPGTLPSGAINNPSLWDSAVNYFGKAANGLFNPGVASTSSGNSSVPDNTGAATPTFSINWKWVLIIGAGLGILWLLIQKR